MVGAVTVRVLLSSNVKSARRAELGISDMIGGGEDEGLVQPGEYLS